MKMNETWLKRYLKILIGVIALFFFPILAYASDEVIDTFNVHIILKPNGSAEVQEEIIVVDMNHPLAGQTLNFKVKIVEIREATEEELEHGHVHGAHGHDHEH